MIRRRIGAVAFVVALAMPTVAAHAQCGLASWYRADGSRTAAGEVHRGEMLTAAHRTLPFGTMVKVRNQASGKEVTVRINDRGPFIEKRIIDLSQSASRALGMGGLAPVCLTVLNETQQPSPAVGKNAPASQSAPTGWEAKTVRLPDAPAPKTAPVVVASGAYGVVE